MTTLDERLARLQQLKQQSAQIDSERKALEQELVAEMREQDTRKVEWPSEQEGVYTTASVVESSTIKVSDDDLLAELTPEQSSMVTKTVVDQKALEHAVATGHIDIELVARHSTEVPRKPYIRFGTKREARD